MDITEDLVELAARKLLVSAGTSGTEYEDLQGWILKFVDHRKKLRISVETFVGWIANSISPWAAYQEFLSGLLFAFDKLPGVRLVGVGENWRRIFSKCMLMLMGPEATHTCKVISSARD